MNTFEITMEMLNLNTDLFHSKINYTSAILYFQFNYLLFSVVTFIKD